MQQRSLQRVELREVSRAFGRSFALHRVDLAFTAGTITALLGGNGAGKSTLLNILATVDQPTSGSVRYDELDFAQFARRGRHRIGWVSHQSLLYEELTARENLHFYGQMYGLDELDHRCHSWLERVGLSEAADRQVRTFSRGMKQRLTVARALISNPRLLLFDEPATGLDQQGTALIRDLLEEMRRRERIVIVVTHNFDLVENLADRVVILRRGKVALDAPLNSLESLNQAYQTHHAPSAGGGAL